MDDGIILSVRQRRQELAGVRELIVQLATCRRLACQSPAS